MRKVAMRKVAMRKFNPYLDTLLLGAARFIIIGVQKPRIKRLKQMPEVWQFEVKPAPGLTKQGRKKYERLLKVF
ncbi:hypothetical protein ACFP2F_08365 [Hymenobacter artigasi]|uniref:Uncharacterized protein n=1 Tax=Hymenobacter artigasi TaxID=2719616 RepID=A0ABX1HG93_9BACT|nr:hypothetical protein [Hymenobacter artigasi]NKI89266.1 hypothetical protein [Hymenobacter artigasi]